MQRRQLHHHPAGRPGVAVRPTTTPRKNPVHWSQPASSMRVTISQGAMHSFNLVVNDENIHYKVTRIR